MNESTPLDYIKQNDKWPVSYTWFTVLERIFDFVMPIMIICTAIAVAIKFGLDDPAQLFYSVILLLIGIAIYFQTLRRIRSNASFQRIGTSKSEEENLTWIHQNIEMILDVKVGNISESERAAQIFTKASLFSWGEEVTLICDGYDILINSKNVSRTLTTFHDRKNIRLITEAIKSGHKQ